MRRCAVGDRLGARLGASHLKAASCPQVCLDAAGRPRSPATLPDRTSTRGAGRCSCAAARAAAAAKGVPVIVIQRQLGHTNVGITSISLQGIDSTEIIDTVQARRPRWSRSTQRYASDGEAPRCRTSPKAAVAGKCAGAAALASMRELRPGAAHRSACRWSRARRQSASMRAAHISARPSTSVQADAAGFGTQGPWCRDGLSTAGDVHVHAPSRGGHATRTASLRFSSQLGQNSRPRANIGSRSGCRGQTHARSPVCATPSARVRPVVG